MLVPKINMKAENYPDLIDLESGKFSEPPLTWHLSDDQIREFVETPFLPPKIPCRTLLLNVESAL